MENRQAAEKSQDDLAESRRLKKRELDRKAQRLARERTKNRIAELESMVSHLQQNETNAQTTSLLDQLSRVTKERDKAVATLRSLSSIIERQITDSPTRKSSPDEAREEPRELPTPESFIDPFSASCSATPGGPELDASAWSLQPWSDNSPLPPQDPLDCLGGKLPTDTNMLTRESGGAMPQLQPADILMPLVASPSAQDYGDDRIPPQPTMGCHCTGPEQEGDAQPNLWRTAIEALGKATRISKEDMMLEELSSHDIPIRAIIEGWDSVERSGKMTKSWRKLRKIDETCFKGCGPVERLACLKTMHQMMMYHGEPNVARQSDLPRWFVQRPSQALMHSHAIDYFVWPGIRERFVFGEHRYCTNLFWDLFQTNFKIRWPFGFRDTYLHNSETGQFQLSPVFEGRIHDLNTWTMGPDFFTPFPELCADIPTSMSVPKTLGGTVDAQLDMYFPQANNEAGRNVDVSGRQAQ